MAGITIPMSDLRGPAAAGPRLRVENETGATVARFGEQMTQIGDALEGDRLDRELARVRVDMTRELGQARLEMDTLGNPDALEATWGTRRAELRETLAGGVDAKNRGRFELAFDELADRHTLSLGTRALDLRQGERRVTLANQVEQTVSAGALADPDTRAANYDVLVDAVTQQIASGALDPEQADTLLRGARQQMDQAAGLRALDTDPGALVASLDAGGYGELEPVYREGLRARATGAVAAAAARAEAETERAAAARVSEIGDRLGTVTAVARAGRVNAWEIDFLADPAVQAHPDYAEAAAAVDLREALPQFATLPVTAQAEMIAAERAKPVAERHETRILEAMEATRAASLAAWERDPLAEAAAQEMQVPPLVLDGDPAALATSFAQRRGFGRSLAETGYVERPTFFSLEERGRLQTAAGTEADPRARAELAASLAAAFGTDAPRALAEIGGDEVFSHMGNLTAAGGNPALAAVAFKGQQAIEAKLVELPSADERLAYVDETFGELFAEDTVTEGAVARVADAIYAGRARGVATDSREAKRLYTAALQEALGQATDARARPTGGVQEIRGTGTLLPVGLRADQVTAGLDAAEARLAAGDKAAMRPWERASLSGGAPLYAGQPLTADTLSGVKLRAVGRDAYALFVERRGRRYDLTDASSGGLYLLSVTALLGELTP